MLELNWIAGPHLHRNIQVVTGQRPIITKPSGFCNFHRFYSTEVCKEVMKTTSNGSNSDQQLLSAQLSSNRINPIRHWRSFDINTRCDLNSSCVYTNIQHLQSPRALSTGRAIYGWGLWCSRNQPIFLFLSFTGPPLLVRLHNIPSYYNPQVTSAQSCRLAACSTRKPALRGVVQRASNPTTVCPNRKGRYSSAPVCSEKLCACVVAKLHM